MEARNKMTMCRLCLIENERFFNIFEVDVWHGYVAAEVISDLFHFKVTDSDGYPHVVCETCLTKLTDYKVFKEQCQTSRVTYDNVFASEEIIVDHHIQRDEFISIKTEPIDPLDKEEPSKNSVKQEIEENGMDIAGVESGSDKIIKTEVVHSFANTTGDDPMASDVMDLPSGTDSLQEELDTLENPITAGENGIHEISELDIKSEIDIYETEIPDEQVEIQKITEMEESTPLEHFHEMEIIQAGVEKNESQEFFYVRRRMECHHCGENRNTIQEIAEHIKDTHNSIFNEDDTPIQQQRKDKKHTWCMSKRRFLCNICNHSYSRKANLKVHLRKHTAEKPFQCNICNYTSSQRVHLKVHMRKHTAEKPFQCNICNYTSSQRVHLKVHMRKHTGEKPFQCNTCNYSCSTSGSLKIHMRKHTGEKPFQCNVCNYSSSTNGSLKRHLRKHTGDKPFQCNICNFSFSISGHLKVHMLKHTGEKPFQCNICNYSCSTSGSLKIHMRKHTGEKPFQCNICNFTSSHCGNLKVHMRKHTGEKPFQCNTCNYSSTTSGSLKLHLRKHTEEKPV